MTNYRIYENGEEINVIVADEAFCEKYCAENGYTYELMAKPETEPKAQPSQLDTIEAQVTYTAMMTDTLLEV